MMGALFRWGVRLLEKVQLYRYHLRIKRLVAKGLTVGKNVVIELTADIDDNYPYLITIGDNCSISNHVRILAHDATTFRYTNGHTRLGKVVLKEDCFIGERTIILPGVTIGPNVLVAAGSVVNRDIPPNSCAAGVPARVYAKFDSLIERHKRQVKDRPVFDIAHLTVNPDPQLKKEVWQAVQDGDAYVKGSRGQYPYMLNVEE